jgi:hypothetical protein
MSPMQVPHEPPLGHLRYGLTDVHPRCLPTRTADRRGVYLRLQLVDQAKIVTFLASAAFTDEEKFLPALYASSSPDTRVASSAEEIIKRTSVSFDNEDLVKRLFEAHARDVRRASPTQLLICRFGQSPYEAGAVPTPN